MIINIQKIKNVGIFKDYNNSTVTDFGRFNLIYGWNGSGKSTLSNLFESIEKQKIPVQFPSAEFNINCENNIAITRNNITNSNLKIRTFNQNFIKENIDWDNSVKSILLVAKDKIEERKRLDQLKKEQEKDSEKYTKEEVEIKTLEQQVSKFMTNSAKHMKVGLQSIDTNDRYYLNYDKRKLDTFIRDNEDDVKSDSSLLADPEIIELTNSAKPDQKLTINFNQSLLNSETFEKAEQRLVDLLKTSAASKTIERLANNADIQTWVSDGLDIHNLHEINRCEFCGNEIPESRIKEIEAHFSDEFKKFKERLTSANQWLESRYIKLEGLPEESSLYDEFRNSYKTACAALIAVVGQVNKEIEKWHEILKNKIDNPFDISLAIDSVTETSIRSLNDAIKSVSDIIKKHNNKTDNFETETKKSKKRLELHYAATEIKDFKYYEKTKNVSDRKNVNGVLKAAINTGKDDIQILEDSLSNEGVGASQFNESLHKFLGRSELSLRFNKDIKGYEIIRNNAGIHDGNLSEGEKMAIAFVYFITKLTENNNKINKTIVVVDDPVSSFDSNHLFHAYSFLRHHCKDAKQLFVLTHNFTYFKLVRDWFYGNNKNRKNRKPPKDINSFFFTIEATVSSPRSAVLSNADSTLVDYNSEYHYLFAKLFSYKDNNKLNRDEAFLTANLSRKLLESFFSFKYPKNRSDISQLLNRGVEDCTVTDTEIKEKIYRFINRYSHSNVIEINEDSTENLMGESYSVIGDILSGLKK